MKITVPLLLLAVAALAANPAAGSVRVYGEAASSGPSLQVRIYADITEPAILSHTFRLYYNARQLRVLSAERNETIWSFHDGIRLLPQSPPDAGVGGEVLFVSGHFDPRDPHPGVTGSHVLLGSVRFGRVTPGTPAFDLGIGRTGDFASFVTADGTVLEAQPGVVQLQSVTPDPLDRDLDGLPDQWEEHFFGNTRADYADDPDGDGVSNLDEAAAGTDPTDPRSNLRLSISERNGRVVLEWPSADGRSYGIDAGKELGQFESLQTEIKATPPLNRLELDRRELGETIFFRLRLE